jgi:folate-binding protein YgfZ
MREGYEALHHGAAWLDVSDRGRIAVRGRDRARLLHNITSNDVKKIPAGGGAYAFLLNPQGRIQADLYLYRFEDHFLIDTEPELREKVPQWIRRYIIADQVELEDVTGATAAIALEGPASAAVLAALDAPVPGAAYAHLPWRDAVIANVSLTGQPGYRIYCTAAARDSLVPKLQAAGARPSTLADARVVRLENGRPRYGEEIRETSLPQETRQLHALSFTKGCYIGQEIVERIRAQGHVNKELVRIEADGPEALPAGTKLAAEGAEAGEIASSVYSPRAGKVVGLAWVRRPHTEPGSSLAAGELVARVI